MEVQINKENEQLLVKISGEISSANVSELEQGVSPIYECSELTIIMDLKGLTYVSSAGLRIFLMAQKFSISKGKKLILRNMNAEILSVFKMTGFVAIFTIE